MSCYFDGGGKFCENAFITEILVDKVTQKIYNIYVNDR